jgi:hypothetical protein
MAEITNADDDRIEVEHNGKTINVPTTFNLKDLETYFGSMPDEWEIDYIFIHEGALRTGAYISETEWVETVYHTDEYHETFNAHTERGWVGETIDGVDASDGCPEEPLWAREE